MNALRERLTDDGLLPEKERELMSNREDIAEVVAEDADEAFQQTLAFMREGRQTIYHGMLIHGHWVGSPDMLARVEGRSNFGDYYYIACDMKRARNLRDEYRFQGCFYGELLERIQGVKPIHGYVLTPDRSILSYNIEAFSNNYHLTLQEIERVMAGDRPAHFLTSGCKQSPWFETCKHETVSARDLSILNRVWREEVATLERGGITTIEELAKRPVKAIVAACPSLRIERIEHMRAQAQVLIEGTFQIIAPIHLPEARTELYFDIESDPLRDWDFLFGILETTKGKETFTPFLSKTPQEEPVMWETFTAFLVQRPDAILYHYGSFEKEVLQRFIARYGAPDSVKTMVASQMIDLLEIIRPSVILPLSFYSLKDIAAYLGFSWRGEAASGVNAVLWFEEYLKTGKESILQAIITYNEDDVRATHHLQKWLKQQMGNHRPVAGRGKTKEKNGAKIKPKKPRAASKHI